MFKLISNILFKKFKNDSFIRHESSSLNNTSSFYTQTNLAKNQDQSSSAFNQTDTESSDEELDPDEKEENEKILEAIKKEERNEKALKKSSKR